MQQLRDINFKTPYLNLFFNETNLSKLPGLLILSSILNVNLNSVKLQTPILRDPAPIIQLKIHKINSKEWKL